jgi:hypothetical protein
VGDEVGVALVEGVVWGLGEVWEEVGRGVEGAEGVVDEGRVGVGGEGEAAE